MAAKPLSLRAYAAHRKELGLPGASHEAVRRAIAAGRLVQSVEHIGDRPRIKDATFADQEWMSHTRPVAGHAVTATPGSYDEKTPDPEIDYNEARRRREIELWRQARVKREADQLELDQRRGDLIPVQEAREEVIERFTVVKTKLLGLPSRVKQRLPHIAADDVRVIDDLVREALEALADGVAAG